MKYKLINAEQDLYYDNEDDDRVYWTLFFESLYLKRRIQRRIRVSYRKKINEDVGRLAEIQGESIRLLKKE